MSQQKKDRKLRWFGFRVTEEEYKKICQLAQHRDLSLADVGRELLLPQIRRLDKKHRQ